MANNELQNTLDRILLEKNTKLIPENIKKGVTILGVVGDATIDMTDATATTDDIVAGKTAYLRDGIATGTMVNNGAISITPQTYSQTIPAGYHNGRGTVKAVTSSIDSDIKANNIKKGVSILGVSGTLEALDTSDATANASTILSGATAYVSGGKVTGTMRNNGRLTYKPSTSAITIPTGYTSGGSIAAVTASIDSNIKAGNIRAGVSILGVNGTLSDSGVDTSDANATADKILTGYSGYVNSEKVNGTMANRGSITVSPRTSRQTFNGGYYSGITVNAVTSGIDSNIKAENIKQGVTILGVAGNVISEDIQKVNETITASANQDIVRTNKYYNRLTVARVTSNVDTNIQAMNIKKGVTILGVTGTLEQDVNYQAGTLTVLSGKYINYSPVWKSGTISKDNIVGDRESNLCTVTCTSSGSSALIKCYFNIVQGQDVIFDFTQTEGISATFSNVDSPISSGTYYNTNGSEDTSVTYTNVEAGSHYIEINIVGNTNNSVFTFKPNGVNIRQKIVSQVYASLESMNLDKSQSVGTYAFIFSLIANEMVEVYRYNGETWIEHSIGDYTNSLLPNEFIGVVDKVDEINGEVIE